MNKSYFGGVVVSQEADAVARELIKEFEIPRLNNLAFILNVDRCFDDHQSLRLWLQHLLDDETTDIEGLKQFSRNKLLSLFF